MLTDAGLTERQLECCALYFYDCLTQGEIGEQLGVAQQVVAQHIAAGVAKLEKLGMVPSRNESADPAVVMTNINMDSLSPDSVTAVW